MINKFLSLTLAQIKNQYRFNSTVKSKYKPLIIIGIGFAFLPMVAMLSFLMYMYGQATAASNVAPQFLTFLFLGAQFVTLFFAVPSLFSFLYNAKDSELLSSLPVKPTIIFLSKMLITYLVEITVTLVMAPLFVAFGIGAGAPVLYYVLLPFVILILPILPLLLTALITIPLMYIVSYFKNRSALSSIFVMLISFIILGGYLYFVYSFSSLIPENSSQIDLSSMQNMFGTVANAAFFDFAFSKAMFASGSVLLNLLIGIGSNAAVLVLSILIASKFYQNGVSAQFETMKKSGSKQLKFVNTGALKSLIIKDFKEILKNTSLAFYCAFSFIFAPLFIVFYMGDTGIMTGTGMVMSPDIKTLIVTGFLIMFCSGMNYTASCAITRENLSLYILKIIPVDYKTIVKAKVILGFLSASIAVIISIIVSIFLLNINILLALLLCGVVLIFNYAFTCLAINTDIKKPRLNYTSIAQGLKNAPSSLISMLMSFVIAVVFALIAVGSYLLFSNALIINLVICVLMYAVSIVLAIIWHKNLYKNLNEKIENIAL